MLVFSRWPLWLLLSCAAGAAAPVASADGGALLSALDAVLVEDEAVKLLAPHMDALKGLDPLVVEKVVMRQWWGLARDIVARSHSQQVDLSFSVRRAVKTLKEEADELLRTLNPKYGQAQQVAPAFQWAQNDTSIFLTIKYTVRWNAPGALEATDINVLMEGNFFNFSGLGKHSNNKYKYVLGLSLFDAIMPQPVSSWSAASVGKLSVTLRKRWARKWPRLLSNKKTKIGNMHVWMEHQEKLDTTLSGMPTASNSPITCAASEKLYCLASDTCKKGDCSQCPGKTTVDAEKHTCSGMPSEKASVSFKDTDMQEGSVGGEVKITKAKNEFDIDKYVLYWGKDSTTKLDPPLNALVGEVSPTGGDAFFSIPAGTPFPSAASHLLVFSKNEYGEYLTPGNVALKDAVAPKAKPGGIVFEDDDGDKGELGGTVTINRASDEDKLDEYALHWGKSATKKISSGSLIKDISKGTNMPKEPSYYLSKSTKIPEGATHMLVYSKNEFSEFPSPASLKFRDNTKPCLAPADKDCPAGVTLSVDEDPDEKQAKVQITVNLAKDERGVTHYAIYWGRRECGGEGDKKGDQGAKNGKIKELEVAVEVDNNGKQLSYVVAENTPVPSGTTHVVVFSKNKYGESDNCVSAVFEDNMSDKKEL